MAAFAPSHTLRERLPLAPGDVVANKYRVDALLGRGGMAAVFAATHLGLSRQFAIKVILGTSGGGDAFARFEREARAAAAIQSPHVIQVFDVGQTESGMPYMVMERLVGAPLSDVLAQRRLRPEEVIAITREICDVLSEAHALGIVHRDLKPDNVFLVERANGQTTTKLLDFGIAMVKDSIAGRLTDLTLTHMFLGTPSFTSPEQFESASLATEKSDVWSLGVLMFEMLTGVSPYKGDNFLQVAKAVVEGPVPSLRAYDLRVPPELADAVARCLRKNPEERCSVRDVTRLLADLRGSMPTQVARVSAAEPAAEPEPPIERAPRSPRPTTQARRTQAGGPPLAHLLAPDLALPLAPCVPEEAPSASPFVTVPAPRSSRAVGKAWIGVAAVLAVVTIGVLVALTRPAAAPEAVVPSEPAPPPPAAAGPAPTAPPHVVFVAPSIAPPASLAVPAPPSAPRRAPAAGKSRTNRPAPSSAALTNER